MHGPRISRWVFVGVAVGVMTVVFVLLLPRFGDYSQALDSVRRLSWQWIAVLAACAALDLVTFAPPWQVALPGLRFWPALAITQASTAASLVTPAGSAVGIAVAFQQLRRRGFSGAETGRAVSLTSLWSQFANLLYPVVAVALLAAGGQATAILVPAAVLGAGLFTVAVVAVALVAASDHLATRTGDAAARVANRVRTMVRRPPVRWGGSSFERFRGDAVDLATLVTLMASLRALGVPASRVSLAEVFAAWALHAVARELLDERAERIDDVASSSCQSS